MKACLDCMMGLTAREDDGTGRHKTCPRPPDREAYLARRRQERPHIAELHDDLKEGLTFSEHIARRTTETRSADCIAHWPECESGVYDPRCCRFPKSCSCVVDNEDLTYYDRRNEVDNQPRWTEGRKDMNGDEVRTARERLGWSRGQLGEQLGLTIAQVARIETKGPRDDEKEHLLPIIEKAGIVVEVEQLVSTTLVPPPPPASSPESSSDLVFELPDPPVSEGDPDDPEAQVVLTEWRGVKRGQVVKIDGEVGKRFTFGYYFRNPSQEYVSVYSLKNGGERSFRPERLRLTNGKVPARV